jgi:arginyl-tRNA synthetase
VIVEKLKKSIAKAVSELEMPEATIVLDHPADMKMGDYSCNIAMALSKKAGIKPRELAEKIIQKLKPELPDEVERVEAAGPGFINFFLSRKFFEKSVAEIIEIGDGFGKDHKLKGEKVLFEYTDPNPFKQFHIGHLMSNAIGESLSRIVQSQGAEVKRACYQGDVGLHVAKAMWGILKNEKDWPKDGDTLSSKTAFLGKSYVEGAVAYETEPKAKEEIDELNKKIYAGKDEHINELYKKGKEWSLAHFEEIYKVLGTKFDFYFFESEMAPMGLFIVEELLNKGIFERSEGAVIFPGEKYGLHTRVFITKLGLPTYETKEMGLAKRKSETYPFDRSITVTANEQNDYFKVVLKAMEFAHPTIANKTRHISHGMMRFASGKMSSRTGNVITGESLLGDIRKMVEAKMTDRDFSDEQKREVVDVVAVAALKFSILRQATGADIIYDAEKSVSFEGDSGPYLQYSYARAMSVLRNAADKKLELKSNSGSEEIETLTKLLYRLPEIVSRAADEYEPHHIVTYLVELAGAFNSWYAHNPILDGGEATPWRLALTEAFTVTLRNALSLLGISSPERM